MFCLTVSDFDCSTFPWQTVSSVQPRCTGPAERSLASYLTYLGLFLWQQSWGWKVLGSHLWALVNSRELLSKWTVECFSVPSEESVMISSAVGFGNTETHTEVCYRREVSILGYTRPCFWTRLLPGGHSASPLTSICRAHAGARHGKRSGSTKLADV